MMAYNMKEIIITVSVLVICILLIRRIFRKEIGSRFQYALWLLVALRLLIPVSIPVSLWTGPLVNQNRLTMLNTDDMVEQLKKPIQVTINSRNGIYRLLSEESAKTVDSVSEDSGASILFMVGHLRYSWLDVMGILWIAGMIMIAAWFLITNVIFGRMLKRERSIMELSGEADSALRERLPEKIAGMYDGMKVYIVKGLTSPCLYGLPGREAVYLTPDITEDTDRLCHVLTHELCHKKHGDSFWGILRGLLVTVYWFHPFVWVAAVLSKRDCELACDETALIFLGEEARIPYGETLLSIITKKARISDFICTATTMTGSGKSVKERMGFIIKKPKVLRIAVVLTVMLMAVVCVFAFTKSHESVRIIPFGENTDTVMGAGMQIHLPESIRGICGQVIEEGNDDIIIYHIESKQEVGRFSRMSLKDALQLVDEGKEIVPLGDFGDNYLLKAYLGFYGGSVTTTTHVYTPANQNEGEDFGADIGMLQHEDSFTSGSTGGTNAVPGTDSNTDAEDIYESGTDSSLSTEYVLLPDENDTTQIPHPEKTDSYMFPLPFVEGQSLDAEEYVQVDTEVKVDYLPDEQISTTTIYPPEKVNIDELSHDGCFIYMKADYDKVEERYFEKMEWINRELESALCLLSD